MLMVQPVEVRRAKTRVPIERQIPSGKFWIARNTDNMDAFILISTPFKKNVVKKFKEVIMSSVLFAEKYDNPNWQVAPLSEEQSKELLSKYKLNELYDVIKEDVCPTP